MHEGAFWGLNARVSPGCSTWQCILDGALNCSHSEIDWAAAVSAAILFEELASLLTAAFLSSADRPPIVSASALWSSINIPILVQSRLMSSRSMSSMATVMLELQHKSTAKSRCTHKPLDYWRNSSIHAVMDIEEKISALEQMKTPKLRLAWRNAFGRPSPPSFSLPLLQRALLSARTRLKGRLKRLLHWVSLQAMTPGQSKRASR